MDITRATIKDAEEILNLQRLAYVSEAAIYNDYTIQPLTQTLQEITSEMNAKTVLKAVENGKIIGSVRAYERDGTCFVGKLIVHPDRQNRGIGSALMKAVEEIFSSAHRFELFTGHMSVRNIFLYNKLGYREYKREIVNDTLTHVFMEKVSQPN